MHRKQVLGMPRTLRRYILLHLTTCKNRICNILRDLASDARKREASINDVVK